MIQVFDWKTKPAGQLHQWTAAAQQAPNLRTVMDRSTHKVFKSSKLPNHLQVVGFNIAHTPPPQ